MQKRFKPSVEKSIKAAATAGSLTGKPSFTLEFRLRRLAWLLCWNLLAAWTPRRFFAWRRGILSLFGAQMTDTSRVYGSARIWWPGNLEMGENTAIGPRVRIYSMGKIRIGANTIVSQDAHLCAGTHDYNDPAFQLITRPVDVGPRVWIATEAFICPGAVIGEGCVVGARAVVSGKLDPWGVYAGNPAIRIKERAH